MAATTRSSCCSAIGDCASRPGSTPRCGGSPRADAFRLGELDDVVPDAASRVVLARRLMREGLLDGDGAGLDGGSDPR